ncbi:hypothetical protein ABKN59_003019 [Abortiporus biennis]
MAASAQAIGCLEREVCSRLEIVACSHALLWNSASNSINIILLSTITLTLRSFLPSSRYGKLTTIHAQAAAGRGPDLTVESEEYQCCPSSCSSLSIFHNMIIHADI